VRSCLLDMLLSFLVIIRSFSVTPSRLPYVPCYPVSRCSTYLSFPSFCSTKPTVHFP
jgi:hypothetical protein